jgi:hypothetical protein
MVVKASAHCVTRVGSIRSNNSLVSTQTAAGAGAVWFSAGQSLARFDVTANRLVATLSDEPTAGATTLCQDEPHSHGHGAGHSHPLAWLLHAAPPARSGRIDPGSMRDLDLSRSSSLTIGLGGRFTPAERPHFRPPG